MKILPLLIAVTGLTCNAADAAIIDRRDYSVDTETNIEWLKLQKTGGMTPYEVQTSGYITQGWRYATQQEFNGLIDNYFGTNLSTQVMFAQHDNLDLLRTVRFLELLGGWVSYANPNNIIGHVQGIVKGDAFPSGWMFNAVRNPGGQDYGRLESPQQWWTYVSSEEVGSYLVRDHQSDPIPVPEPSSLSMMVIGALALRILKQRAIR